MKKGPNKILLQAEDLLFIEPKAASCKSVKSNLFDKSDRLPTSRNSLSSRSVGFDINTTRTARYNGELVFVKALKMKDFEMKNILRHFIKQGMKYVHSSLLRFHGSLRSVNCVIDSRWVLKVTDYGVNQFYQKCKAKRPLADKDLLWMAPEHLREDTETPGGSAKGDVYSFAIIMQELILRGAPYCMLNIDVKGQRTKLSNVWM
ncbi:hypothetical protein NP493_160g00023 [Ridgeia piscesae]|uniref:guanylate cyclase n=1 Tax=Ridgeia piscesae TaxID=27915 RepID=A0AAD9P3X6_RIDPI|nr:hypothetical protein NP493_160g00023 [Ridgeia piscesae]